MLATDAGGPVSKSELDQWGNAHGLAVTLLRDPDATPSQTISTLVRRELCYVVDLTTMRILDVIDGSVAGQGESSASRGMTEIEGLLGVDAGVPDGAAHGG